MDAELIESFDLGLWRYEIYSEKPSFDHIELKQVHSDKVISHKDWKAEIEADGIYSTTPLITPLAIRTADCLPIGLIGKNGVANIHAGWRGLHRPILNHPSLKELNIHTAFIGPHISCKNYEVGSEFENYFPGFVKETNGSYYLSLKDIAKKQLLECFGRVKIYESELCTYENPRLNSFRLNKTEKRNYNILRNK